MREAFQKRIARFHELERLMSDPEVLGDLNRVKAYAKEHAALRRLVECHDRLEEVEGELRSIEQLHASSQAEQPMRELAQAELERLKAEQNRLTQELERFLMEEDPEGERSVIVEIRAGTGGAEASLFAADLFRMYHRYAVQRAWKVEALDSSPSEVGGFKEVIFAVEGEGVFRRLRFERGVHRVQRVPATEASGRIHTSTVTVAVMPQAQELEVQIDSKDLRIDVYRSSGPGGQGVNTTDSAVRITHLPTGLVVSCQDERSQLKNKAKAMKVLRARLLELKDRQQAELRTQERRAQIGSGERSEKIRTYNFPDRRVTDHRINFTSHRLEDILNGAMDELLEPLLEADRQARLMAGM